MMSANTAGPARGHYSEAVRRLFRAAGHAGELTSENGHFVVAEAVEGGAGARIRLSGRAEGGRWLALRYRIFGCPHLIAAAESVCERFEGAAVDAVRNLAVADLVAELEIPVEKTGRLLLLEDAFRQLAAGLEKSASGPQHWL
jgi:NifU-like protein involved in Fe-S cluster formation